MIIAFSSLWGLCVWRVILWRTGAMIVASSLGLIRREILEQFLDPFRHNADVLHRLVGVQSCRLH